jgi:hypothetical protein
MESVLSGRDILESSKLEGAKNYAIWSFKVRTVLQEERVWQVVDPTTMSITNSASSNQSGFASASRSGLGSGSDIGALTTHEARLSTRRNNLPPLQHH